MEVALVLHMNKGSGESSYAKNSTLQSKIMCLGKAAMEEGILKILKKSSIIPESMGIADLGCSTGPNSLAAMTEIVKVIEGRCCSLGRPSPELRLFLNDLFDNDFNNIFATLPTFYNRIRQHNKAPCYISAVPGSFYGRLFPTNSLHFVHSSSSLHWLSQVPKGLQSEERRMLINKGKIYLSKSSPQCIVNAYLEQFQNDFSLFLSSRAEELVSGGRMVLSFMGRTSSDPTADESCYYQWEFLGTALMAMVSEGLIEEEKVDSFNAPYYAPCPDELRNVIEKEGSFILDDVEAFPMEWDGGAVDHQQYTTVAELSRARGQRVTKTIRAVVESMLEAHFGTHIMDDLFKRYQDIVADYLSNASTKYINLVISLRKKETRGIMPEVIGYLKNILTLENYAFRK
ncbi:probable jasmonic acid carboxyl methyltransferase 2 [Humulus lupulus]|uniref:probable jasmonic acid carboxyl methyltransferase 2 n=1 Tax=Humulus lupulus TaxID=3486 RepID=UPI002B400C8A|nr:probable jasmonic acid carboxyl methyltransferase 2 [Humulus lupulus]